VASHIGTPDAAAKADLNHSIQSMRAAVNERLSAYENTITTDEDRALYAKEKLTP
jgi:hypothetical protein